jgi:luciferase family oxidoreductase group 1
MPGGSYDEAMAPPLSVLGIAPIVADPEQAVRAIPGAGTIVPLRILGSSLYGAQLAAALGLPYAFASHFAPQALLQALEVYRTNFSPSNAIREPYAMVAANVIAADSDREAQRLFTSARQAFTNLFRGRRDRLPAPIDDIDAYWAANEKARVSAMLTRSFVGAPDTVRDGLERFAEETEADELIVATAIHDHQARLGSYELLAAAYTTR